MEPCRPVGAVLLPLDVQGSHDLLAKLPRSCDPNVPQCRAAWPRLGCSRVVLKGARGVLAETSLFTAVG